MRAPGSGRPSRVRTLPRSTAARTGVIAPGVTSVWTGFGPPYRNAVEAATVVATVASIGVATVLGSGGNPDDVRVTERVTVVLFPAASVPTVAGLPLTVTVTAVVASVAVPCTSTVSLVTVAPSVGAVSVRTGGCVSRVTIRTAL